MGTPSSDTLGRLLDIGIIPIVRFSDAEKAAHVAEALIAGNVPALEISLSLPESLAVLESVAARFGNRLLLGAGTVLNEGWCAMQSRPARVTSLPRIPTRR